MNLIFLIIFATTFMAHAWDKPDLLIINDFIYAKVSNGLLRGFSTNSTKQFKQAYVFKKIPFAKAPIGKLRFEPLQHLKHNWQNVLDATKYGPACLSNSTHTSSSQEYISEDCIYANVFTSPACFNMKNKCAVLVYIHGGNFLYDSAVMFNDQQIVDKYASDDVIFVTIAYRLGAFGFLDLGSDQIVKRNLGLYDIVFGLQWIQKEISNFGGSKNRITVMGNSGGANAIEFIMESRAIGKNVGHIFNQAVFSSPAPTFRRNINLAQTEMLIEKVGCSKNFTTAFSDEKNDHVETRQKVECLRNVDSIKLLSMQASNEDFGFVFQGVGSSPDFPSNNFMGLLKNLKPSRILMSTVPEEFRSQNDDIESECLQNAFNFNYTSSVFLDTCINRYKNLGTNKRFISGETIGSMAHLFGAINRKNGGQTFRASFRLENHTTHASDLLFFFGLHWMRNQTFTFAEQLMDLYYPLMIKNFVKTGTPALEWKPTDEDDSGFFVLDFKVTNKKVVEYPLFLPKYDNPNGLKFWIFDGLKIEAISKLFDKKAKIYDDIQQNRHQNIKAQDQFHKQRKEYKLNHQNSDVFTFDKNNYNKYLNEFLKPNNNGSTKNRKGFKLNYTFYIDQLFKKKLFLLPSIIDGNKEPTTLPFIWIYSFIGCLLIISILVVNQALFQKRIRSSHNLNDKQKINEKTKFINSNNIYSRYS